MLPILQIGPLALQTPGLILLLCLWTGLSASEQFAPRRAIHPETLSRLVMFSLLGGLVGARLGFAAPNSTAYMASPASLFSLSSASLDVPTGVLTSLIIGLVYGQRAKLPLWATLDALTPLLAFLALGLTLAHAALGTGYGAETNLPWGISLFGAKRHPTHFYQLGLDLLTLLWLVSWSRNPSLLPGRLFWLLAALTSASHLLIESFRADTPLLPGGFRTYQIIAWLVLAIALWALKKEPAQYDQ